MAWGKQDTGPYITPRKSRDLLFDLGGAAESPQFYFNEASLQSIRGKAHAGWLVGEADLGPKSNGELQREKSVCKLGDCWLWHSWGYRKVLYSAKKTDRKIIQLDTCYTPGINPGWSRVCITEITNSWAEEFRIYRVSLRLEIMLSRSVCLTEPHGLNLQTLQNNHLLLGPSASDPQIPRWKTAVWAERQWIRETPTSHAPNTGSGQRGRRGNCEGASTLGRIEEVSQGMFWERVGITALLWPDKLGFVWEGGAARTGWGMEGSSLTDWWGEQFQRLSSQKGE